MGKNNNPTDSFFRPSKSSNSANAPASNDFFVKPSKSSDNKSTETKDKKPFDKKKWRLQKYSMKHKIQNWEDRRKKAVLREYFKNNDKGGDHLKVKKIYEEEEKREGGEAFKEQNEEIGQLGDNKIMTNEDMKKHSYKKAHVEFLRIQEEKKRKKEESREEYLKKKADKEEARQESKKKRTERYKKLSKKTKKGQPIMKERLEDLLEKIQNSVSKS